MNKQPILYGVIGLLAGVIITWAVATTSVNNNYTGMMNMMGMRTTTDSRGMMDNDDMTMGEMSASLQDKTGDDFDKAFLSGMITHHQGAISMANFARTNAKHEEIKSMANDIVTAQTKEINQMKMWQAQWGYASSTSSSDHDMMNMGH